jgi:branched-chain amino acid transport system permease protein
MPTANDLLNAVLTGLGIGGLFAVIALGLSLVFGVMRLMNLAHGEFIVLGAYIVFYLATSAGLDPLVATLIAAPVVALIAYPLQHYALSPVMSRGAEAPLLITFGVSVILQNVFIVAFSADVRSLNAGYASANVNVLGVTLPVIYIICLVVAVVLLGATHLVLTRTGFGRRLRASSEDAVAAEVMGVNVKRVYSMTYALAAGSAALGGCLIGLTFSFAPTTGTAYLVTGFAVVVLGGVGSVKGTLLGGLMLGVIESIGATFVGDGWRVFIGCILVLIVLSVRPQGLFGSARGA